MKSIFVVVQYPQDYDQPSKLYGAFSDRAGAEAVVSEWNTLAKQRAREDSPHSKYAEEYAETWAVVEIPLEGVTEDGVRL